MAYSEENYELLAQDLAHIEGIVEKKMFGGKCFMLNGNMLCGVHKNGAMFRVGKEHEAEALAVDIARPMDFTKRPMKGFIEVDDSGLEDGDGRAILLRLALAYVGAMPAK